MKKLLSFEEATLDENQIKISLGGTSLTSVQRTATHPTAPFPYFLQNS